MNAAKKNFEEFGAKFAELVRIMARLRAPGGCPWDRKQTLDTIKGYLLEETYEVLDAIDKRNWRDLTEELGDLLLQPVFLAEMAAEDDLFNIGDALDTINQKLVRRHPHIFGDASAETAEDVKRRWDEIKRQEKQAKGEPEHASILDAIPRNLPALVEADKIGKRAVSIGFDWPNVDGALQKLQEEAGELAEAQGQASPEHIEHELGDILFCVVNVARFLKVDPEQALRKANARFRRRFAHVERGTTGEPASLDRMEELWQEAKTLEPKG
ncbi:MAG TPA: nucleoside triphosphate pyrophosphohydrolase [Bryobacteraceae bacterium]|jgi:MazG family protein|nr:nucleoside triphosphate pyrophosphohydrolase [Bryobacteraceae bacterium]